MIALATIKNGILYAYDKKTVSFLRGLPADLRCLDLQRQT